VPSKNNPLTDSLHEESSLPVWAIVIASIISLAIAMGISRFTFTPILPMMIHDGVITLSFGSTLASLNYLGYLIGALMCMWLPSHWSSAALVRWGLLLTAILTLGMVLDNYYIWLVLRFLAGMISAIVLVHTSRWCLALLITKGRISLGSMMFTGVGLMITLSGLMVSGMIQLGWSSTSGWICFGMMALVLTVLIWHIFQTKEPPPPQISSSQSIIKSASHSTNTGEMSLFSFAYGLAGFGYIITATFLPIIARTILPPSDLIWADLFWPAFGLSAVIGSISVSYFDWFKDPRIALVICYLLEATGVVGAIFIPTIAGFFISSLLAGLPFNVINFYTMREVTRLRPLHAARYMGLLTALFSIGQIVGPPLVNVLLKAAHTQAQGFSWSLQIAALALVIGAGIFGFLAFKWPIRA